MAKRFTLMRVALVLLSLLILAYSDGAIAAPIDDVIAAAKKEGAINYFNTTGIPIYEMEKGLKDAFGVDIKLSITPGRQTEVMAKQAMLIKSGAQPEYDAMHMAASNYIATAVPNGLVEEIDFKPLLTKDTDPKFLVGKPANFLCTWGYAQTIAYNPNKIKESELPKTYKELADPKWQGKFGWIRYGTLNAELIFYLGLGKEKGLKYLSDIIANKPLLSGPDGIRNGLMLGEISFGLIGTHEYNQAFIADPKSPLKTHILKDYLQINEYTDVVLKNAKNKNAATLLVIWFASPAGRALHAKVGHCSYMDPGTTENKLVAEAKKSGIKVVYPSRDPKYYNFMSDPATSNDLIPAIDLIMRGGQQRGGDRGGRGNRGDVLR